MDKIYHRLLIGTVLLAASAGVLALIMFWLALLGIGWNIPLISVIWLACMIAIAAAMVRHVWHPLFEISPDAKNGVPTPNVRRDSKNAVPIRPSFDMLMLVIILIIAAAVLFNGGYFPFSRDDALGIYRPAALSMWQTGTLVPLIGAESLYRTYPILIPLNYTFVYLASGWENEMLAKTIATLLSLGCLPAAYLLGHEIGGRRVGLFAMIILALTPAFVRWGSSGYVDLPMAFTYTMAALFALRFWRGGRLVDAALAGAMMGLAAFTKNAGLIGVPLLAGWMAVSVLTQRRKDAKRFLGFAIAILICALIAAPFYIRNLIGAGFLIPDTAWTEQAERSLRTLAIFLTLTDNFLVSGWVIMAGIVFTAWQLIRRVSNWDGYALILWFTVPFFAAWWVFVSYDPRFLMLFYPILCVGGAALVDTIVRRLTIPRTLQIAVVVGVLATVVYCTSIAVEFKGAILRNPLMTVEEKIALVRDAP